MALECLTELNEQQLKAANILYGPVVVYAGAGTGKTKTLTYRVANMVDNGICPANILAITFTKKATNEMRERLMNLIGPMASTITISTIHALCAKILRRDITYLDYERNFTIIDDEDQLKVLSDCLEEMGVDRKAYTAKYAKKVITSYKCFNIKPKSYVDSQIVNKYEAMLKELNLLDFDDLLLKTDELLSCFPKVLEKYQNLFQHILVDEFQDTDTVQYHIISMLAKTNRNLFLVGDDDQSIYSFRGTNYENIKKFKAEFPEYKSVILNKNYRSTQNILDGCNRLIDHNTDREKKNLSSDMKGFDDDITVYKAIDDNDEVDYVVNKIKALVRSGYEYTDIAVLYRNTSSSRQFEHGLIQSKIPYHIWGGLKFLQRKEVKDFCAYLKLLVLPDDVYSFKRIINVPSRLIGLKTVEKILEYKKEHGCTIEHAVEGAKDNLGGKYVTIKNFFNDLEECRKELENLNLDEIFDKVFETFEFNKSYEDEENALEREENVKELKSTLVSLEDDGELISRREKLINAFDEALLADDIISPRRDNKNGITLSTIHSVKGLEYKAVFVTCFEENIFPNTYRYETDEELEEERRVAYVACTRAKCKLFLTHAKQRLLYGQKMKNPRSRFLSEFIEGQKKDEPVELPKVSIFKPEKEKHEMENNTKYKVGDKVMHTVFGEGILVGIDDNIGTICFTAIGAIKKFDMNHKSITKL